MTRNFRPRRTFAKELRGQPEFRAVLAATARELEGAIVFFAGTFAETGHYARSVTARGNRVELRDIAWHIIEYGSVKNPPYAPVRRAVRAAGLRFVDGRTDDVLHMPGIS